MAKSPDRFGNNSLGWGKKLTSWCLPPPPPPHTHTPPTLLEFFFQHKGELDIGQINGGKLLHVII